MSPQLCFIPPTSEQNTQIPNYQTDPTSQQYPMQSWSTSQSLLRLIQPKPTDEAPLALVPRLCTCPCCSRQVNFPTGAFRWPVTFMMPNYLTWSHNALKQIETPVPLIYIGSALREHILTSHAILCLKFLVVVNMFCSFDHSDKWNPQVNLLVNDISLFKRLLDLLILDLGAFLCSAQL